MGGRSIAMRCGGRVFLSVIICVFSLGSSAEGFFHKKKAPTSVADDYFKKLGIERPGKVIRAPSFALDDLSAKRVSLKDLQGKVVFLNFWATWCVPCRQEMPTMEKLQREMKEQGLEVVAINIKESQKAVRKFTGELGMSFTVLLDKDAKVSEEYGAWAIPLSYFINRKGEFVGKVDGPREWDGREAKAFFLQLLREKN